MRVAVLSSGRQDWGILRSTCLLLRDAPDLELRMIAAGMALSSRHGRAVDQMRADGIVPCAELDWLAEVGDDAGEQASAALRAVARTLEAERPDALLLVGDRFETMSAAAAATLVRTPLVHLHGGEETEGAFDNAFRHAITKLAHLHLVSHELHGRRVIAMGEDPSAVHVVGAPGLDNLRRSDLPGQAEIEARLALPLEPPVVIVTLHPATLGAEAAVEADTVIAAMDALPATYVITLPNSDPGSEEIRVRLAAAAQKPRRVATEALGEQYYWGLMRHADAMLGNSSSALLEAPALALPAVDVGARQRGRLRGPNVIHAETRADAIRAALERALDPDFRSSIDGASRALFGDGRSGRAIVDILRVWTPPSPPVKRTVLRGA